MSPVKKGGTNTGDYCSSLSYGLFGQGHHHHHCFNPFCYIDYSMPNPLAYVMAFNNLSLSFSLLEYSGSKSTLKHVWDVGNLRGKQNKQTKRIQVWEQAVHANKHIGISQMRNNKFRENLFCLRIQLSNLTKLINKKHRICKEIGKCRIFFFYLSVSGPFLAMIIFNFPSPPTGALSVPVVNCKNSLFCSSVNEWTISQNSLSRKKSAS